MQYFLVLTACTEKNKTEIKIYKNYIDIKKTNKNDKNTKINLN